MANDILEERVAALEDLFRELRGHLDELSLLRRRGGSLNDRTVEHYSQLIVKSIEKRGLH